MQRFVDRAGRIWIVATSRRFRASFHRCPNAMNSVNYAKAIEAFKSCK
jgi:hypothetical protein